MSVQTAAEAARPPLPMEMPASCWFMASHETVPVTVGSVILDVRRDVPAKAAFEMASGLMQSTVESWQEYTLRKAAAFIAAWSLPQDLPEDPAEKIALFRSMRRGRFEQLYEALLKHEAAHARGVFKGVSYTEAQWAAHVAANKTKKAKAPTEVLPKWADLLTYIEPEVSLAADAWFVTDDAGVTLQLPDSQWIRIKSELTQGEHIQLVASTKAEVDGVSAAGWVGARKLSFYIQDWSLTYPDGRKAPVGMDSLAEIDAQKFAVLNHTVDAYERRLKQEREASPTSAELSTRHSASANA